MKTRNILLCATLVSVFALIVVGAYVTAGNYGSACGNNIGTDWPLCQGALLPPPQLPAIAEYSHRLLATLSSVFLFVTTFAFWRARETPLPARRSLYAASLLIVVEILLGGAVITSNLATVLVTIHQANALLIFGFTVAAGAFVTRS